VTRLGSARVSSLCTWLTRTAGFVALPLAGLAGTAVAGHADEPVAALVGGAVTGPWHTPALGVGRRDARPVGATTQIPDLGSTA
jgi:hypothetical protein